MSTSIAICPHCRNVIPDSAPEGLCPRCVLSSAATPAGSSPGPTLLRDHGAPPAIETLAAAFPHLEILSLVGSGGMGFVYHALHYAHQRRVSHRDIKPWLAGSEPPGRQAAVAAQLGLSEGALKVAIHRLRKRFREAILHELRQTLPDTDDPEDELRYLIEVLAQP